MKDEGKIKDEIEKNEIKDKWKRIKQQRKKERNNKNEWNLRGEKGNNEVDNLMEIRSHGKKRRMEKNEWENKKK